MARWKASQAPVAGFALHEARLDGLGRALGVLLCAVYARMY